MTPPSPAKAPRINLADLDQPMELIQLPSGRAVSVRMIDGVGMQLRRQMEHTDDETLLWKIAQRCLPDASEEEVYGLTATQAAIVVGVAAGSADRLVAAAQAADADANPATSGAEGSEGNAPRPTRPTSGTKSAASSSSSPARSAATRTTSRRIRG